MVLNKILEDGSISEAELNDFHELCCTLLGIKSTKKRKKPSRKQPGQLAVLFTGFGPDSKKEPFETAATTAGFHVVQSKTKALDYLVCGPKPGPTKVAHAKKVGAKIVSTEEWKPIVSAAVNS